MANVPFEPMAALPEMNGSPGTPVCEPPYGSDSPAWSVRTSPTHHSNAFRFAVLVNVIVVQSSVAHSSPPSPWTAASCQ